jgi:hypothetical protein
MGAERAPFPSRNDRGHCGGPPMLAARSSGGRAYDLASLRILAKYSRAVRVFVS